MIDADLSGFELRPAQRRARREDGPLDLHRVPTGREILREAEAAGAPHPTWKFWVWLNKAENLASLEQARAELVASKKERTHHKHQPGFAWHQLLVTSSEADICPPTRVGVDPFNADPKGECCCSRGDLIGLNLLSEVSVRAESRGDADFVCSRQFIGTRRGLLRPRRVVLISPKARRLFESMNLKGANVEVAHLA
jgi:hypothetical protein